MGLFSAKPSKGTTGNSGNAGNGGFTLTGVADGKRAVKAKRREWTAPAAPRTGKRP